MKAVLLALLAALGASAAETKAPTRPKADWLKTYALQPYREIWSGPIEVKKLDAALPKLVAAVEKGGGKLTQPLANFPGTPDEQQISILVPLPAAKPLLKELRKLGKVEDPLVRRMRDPTPLPEVREKLGSLLKERAEQSLPFTQMPASAALVDALIEHLSAVIAVETSGGTEVLWNIVVREKK